MKTLNTLVLLLCSFICFGQTELLSNGDFNNVSGGWTNSRDFYYNTRFTSYNLSSGYAYLANSNGQRANNLSGDITQTITIPTNTTSATFTFYYSIQTEESNTSKNDWLDVRVLDNNNNPLWDIISLSNTDYTSSVNASVRYQKISFSVPSYLFGKKVKVHFFGSTNSTNPTIFRIDDVSLLASTGSSGTRTACMTWIGGVVPSNSFVIEAFDNLCDRGVIEPSIRAERLANFRIVDAATVTVKALYGGTPPTTIPSDYFPTLFGDIDNLSFDQHRSIKAMCFLEGNDGRPALSRDFSMIQPFKVITPGDVLRMLLEAWGISPRMNGYNINEHNKSSFLDNVYSDDYNYGYIQQAERLGLIDDFIKNNKLTVPNVGEFYYVSLEKLFNNNGDPDIADDEYYHPNNIHLNNTSGVRDIKEATFTTYEQSGFDIPSGGFGLEFVYSYHSDWLDMPVNGLNLALTNTYGNYQNERAKQRSFPLGLGWTHTYNIFAQSILDENYEDKYLLIRWGDGSLVVYNVQLNKFETTGIYETFNEITRQNGHITKFTITSKDFVTTTFEKSSGDTGTDNPSIYIVKEIKNLQGHKLLFDYETADCKNTVSGCKGTSEVRLKSVTDNFANRALTFHYWENSDLLTQVTDNLGRTISFVIDIERLELIAGKDANGATTRYEYLDGVQGKNLLTTIIRPKGNSINNTYSQRKLKQTSTPDYVAEIDFTSEYKKSTKTTTSTVSYTQSSNKYAVSYKYNDAGILQSIKSATEDLDFDYGDNKNPTLPTWIDDDNTGIQQQFKYDNNGNFLEATTYNGNLKEVNKYTYNLLNKPVTHIWPNGTVARYEYDNLGNKTKEIVSSLATEFGYNANGTLAWQKDTEGIRTDFAYNQYGNVNLIKLGGNTPITYSAVYDNVSRLVSAVNPNGVQTSYSYDSNDNLKSVTQDPTGLSLLTQYTYDSNNNLVVVKPPLGSETTLTYNDSDDLEEERQGYFYKQWRYNEDGTLRSFTNKLFDYFPYEYFKKGDANEGKVKSNGYQNFTYDSKTRLLKSVRSPITGDELRYSYDGLTKVNAISFTGRGLQSEVGYTYDVSGNITKINLPLEGKSVSYEYDDLNRVKEVKDWNNKKIITYKYTANNLLQSEEYDNGMVVHYHYDGANRLDSIYSVDKEGKLIHAIGTTLDKVGNHLQESYYVKYDQSGPIQGGSGNFPINYTYTEESRLVQVNNRQIIENRNGNILDNATVGFSNGVYDIRDNLISCTLVENSKTFLYDPLENRYGNNETRYIVDYLNNANVLATKKVGTSTIDAFYVHSPFGLVCSLDPTTAERTYNLYDFRGSTVATVDKNQKVIDYFKYDPFGQVSGSAPTYSSSKTPFLFVGKYGVMHESSQFYFMRARYYDARSGRFMSEDPVWGTNLFTYGNNNPLSHIDPNGEWVETALDVASLIIDANAFSKNPSFKNFAFLTWGIASVALPIVPGSYSLKAIKKVNQLETRFVSTSKGITDLKPTLDRITSGTKFIHRNDGSIFKNFEGLLPKQSAGFYREFVHPTSGVKGAGLMRIITGKNGKMWFTIDHYKTFIPIR